MRRGDQFRHSFNVDEVVYSGFINLFHDRNPLHTDEEFAKTKGFKGKVMHGNILGGFISFFIGECLPIKNVIIHTQEIKYLKPVYLEDEIVLQAEIIDKSEAVNAYIFKLFFTNQTGIIIAKGSIRIGVLN